VEQAGLDHERVRKQPPETLVLLFVTEIGLARVAMVRTIVVAITAAADWPGARGGALGFHLVRKI
jgi:hypothetical protein